MGLLPMAGEIRVSIYVEPHCCSSVSHKGTLKIHTSQMAQELYTQITGYDDDIEELDPLTVKARIGWVSDILEEECNIFVILPGPIRDLHLTIDPDVVKSAAPVTRSGYADMFYSLEERDDNPDPSRIVEEKFRRLELRRYYDWVRTVLFLKNEDDYPFKLSFYDPTVVATTADQVLYNGVDFYFLRVGEVNVEALTGRYSTYELLLMCAYLNLSVRSTFMLGVSSYGSKDEVAGLVINALDTLKNADPRCYLTHTGVVVLHLDADYDLHRYKPETLLRKVLEYGIPQFYNGQDAYHKLVMATLDNNFFLYEDDHHLSWDSQVVNEFLYTNPSRRSEDVQYKLFFGRGDGVTRMQVFDQAELMNLWTLEDTVPFLNPYNLIPFSLRQIRELLMMDVQPELKSVILDRIIAYPVLELTIPSSLSRSSLVCLFNAGSVLSDLSRKSFQPEYRAFDLTSASAPIYPLLRQRPKVIVHNIIVSLLRQQDELGELWYVDPHQGLANTTDLMWSLKGILLLLLECNRYSLWDTITYFGNGLMSTAEWYMQARHKMSICATEAEVWDTGAALYNQSILPGDYK
jgi:hypothetical protein